MNITLEKTRSDPMQGKDRLALAQEKGQYTLWQILAIWLAGGAPIWTLGWVIYPVLSQGLSAVDAGLLRIKLLTIGLIWQFVLSLIVLYQEEGNIRLSTIRRRFWLNNPISPRTGQKNNRLWWWILPLFVLVVTVELAIAPALDSLWTKLFPFLAEPQGYSGAALFAPELRAQWIGAWSLLALMVMESVFNSFLGEEFLFHGVLLPKMQGVFGRWDWVANGVMFGLYHLHQPWSVPGNILYGLLVAFVGRRYHTNWFPIILHSAQAIYFIFLILGLILGLA